MRLPVKRSCRPALVLNLLLCGAVGADDVDYLDSQGRTVTFPLGELSFADEVVSFEKGKPAAAAAESEAGEALGAPDYDRRTSSHDVTLGCRGSLTLRFTDNALVDVDGADLYVFEIGPAVEPTELSVSVDGERWIRVGEIAGGRAEVDIREKTRPGEVFAFVRLVDLASACGGRWPGADIDAVGAIGTGLVLSLESAVLFDVDRFTLKAEAETALREAARKIGEHPGATIRIEGHTDSTGSAEHNLTLSRNRAQAVRDYLATVPGLDRERMATEGHGMERPVAPNETEAGRGRNRRVEIIVIPEGPPRS